ncbi:hypothetical protein HPB50_012561 [Hyalomma asiaticum]|uniref:Uncharacterized protein n=1 Tax=Hyalomma asiaticum TaxID=266040 RepID=A0ACB7TN57_HYAAI|nr:hypothetical protein HPB50_012561 [Hyalomma asiaticum]
MAALLSSDDRSKTYGTPFACDSPLVEQLVPPGPPCPTMAFDAPLHGTSEIRDLLVAPPAENAYTALTQLLIRRLTPSEPQRLQQLLHNTELGDRTPSQLFRHMRQLLHTDGATTTDADSRLLCELFLQRLPVNVRMILASAADKRLSELADSVLAVAPPSVAALQPDIAGRAPTTELHDIREQISRLADTVAAMQARSTPEERQRPAAQQKTCCNHSRKGLRLFRFPSSPSCPSRRKRWLAEVKRDSWEPTAASRVCS